MRLEGHFALVTGAAGGIGGAITERFKREGARVISTDLTEPDIGDVRLACNIGADSDVMTLQEKLTAMSLQPTIVVHSAAVSVAGTLMETALSDHARLCNVNTFSAIRLLQAFAPAMQQQRRGSFIFISSINADFATPGQGAYAASKAALDSLVKTASLELAPDNIRVNSVCPASVDTPLLRHSIEAQADPVAALQRNIERHPLGRIGTAEDIANLVLFLASDEAAWITGVSYRIDGGAGVTRR